MTYFRTVFRTVQSREYVRPGLAESAFPAVANVHFALAAAEELLPRFLVDQNLPQCTRDRLIGAATERKHPPIPTTDFVVQPLPSGRARSEPVESKQNAPMRARPAEKRDIITFFPEFFDLPHIENIKFKSG